MTDDTATIETVLDAIEGVMTAHFAGLADLTVIEYGRLARLVTSVDARSDAAMVAVLAAVEVAIAAIEVATSGDRPEDLCEFASCVVGSLRSADRA